MRLFFILLCACSNAADPHTDGPLPPVDAPPEPDAPAAQRILVINEVAASETPDWFEVVNVSGAPIQLDQFIYVDIANDFAKARPFPPMMLVPGAYYVQTVDDATSGFKLAGDEELWVYGAANHALSDGVDWAQGDSPAGMSFARSPDKTGMF